MVRQWWRMGIPLKCEDCADEGKITICYGYSAMNEHEALDHRVVPKLSRIETVLREVD